MSKMIFTFRWGKSIYVTDKDLKKILLNYYTKTEVDDILKQYVTKIDLAGELVEYAKLDDLHVLDNHLTELIKDTETSLNNNIRDTETSLNNDISRVDNKVDNNTTNITNNKIILDDVVEQLKNAKLWNIVGYYNNSYNYKIGDVVGYQQDLYVCLRNNTVGILPPSSTTTWGKVTGVQQINLDDYYTKTQITNLLQDIEKRLNDKITDNTNKINANKNLITTNTNNIRNNTNNITTNTNNINSIKANYVTTNTSQTITSQKLYSRTPTSNEEIVNKRYVDSVTPFKKCTFRTSRELTIKFKSGQYICYEQFTRLPDDVWVNTNWNEVYEASRDGRIMCNYVAPNGIDHMVLGFDVVSVEDKWIRVAVTNIYTPYNTTPLEATVTIGKREYIGSTLYYSFDFFIINK